VGVRKRNAHRVLPALGLPAASIVRIGAYIGISASPDRKLQRALPTLRPGSDNNVHVRLYS